MFSRNTRGPLSSFVLVLGGHILVSAAGELPRRLSRGGWGLPMPDMVGADLAPQRPWLSQPAKPVAPQRTTVKRGETTARQGGESEKQPCTGQLRAGGRAALGAAPRRPMWSRRQN